MTYKDEHDQDPGVNELPDFYEDDVYEELYRHDSFGERVDSGPDDDESVMEIDEEEMIIEKKSPSSHPSKLEEGFGEAISPDTNPHIHDQLEDDKLRSEAEAEYAVPEPKGIVQKARQKLDEWTDKYDRE